MGIESQGGIRLVRSAYFEVKAAGLSGIFELGLLGALLEKSVKL